MNKLINLVKQTLANFITKVIENNMLTTPESSEGIVVFNKTYPTYKALAEDFGLDAHLVRVRINSYGWPIEKAVLTPKHASIKRGYSQHPLLLKHPALFKLWHQCEFKRQSFVKQKNKIVKKVKVQRKNTTKALVRLMSYIDNRDVIGHGRYTKYRLQCDHSLALQHGCVYLALIPSKDGGFYLKVGISKYLTADKRKASLPKGSMIISSVSHELHRCFQAEQIILKTLRDLSFDFDHSDWFDGYTEVLCRLPERNSSKKSYKKALKNAVNQTVSFKELSRK